MENPRLTNTGTPPSLPHPGKKESEPTCCPGVTSLLWLPPVLWPVALCPSTEGFATGCCTVLHSTARISALYTPASSQNCTEQMGILCRETLSIQMTHTQLVGLSHFGGIRVGCECVAMVFLSLLSPSSLELELMMDHPHSRQPHCLQSMDRVENVPYPIDICQFPSLS